MKKRLLKLKWGTVAALFTIFGLASTVFAVSDVAPPGGVPIQSSLAVANMTSGDGKYHESVNAKVDEVVKFEVWYHNPEPTGSNKIAKNVNVKINIPAGMRKTHTATSTVSGSNTNTETDIATVNTAIDTSLEYIPGTAYRKHNIGTSDKMNIVTEKISDSVVAGGYVIPEVKPCWEFQETITVQARVKAPVFTVDKFVKIEGEKDWKTSISAKAGDKLAYMIAIKNVSNVTLTKMLVRDSFPPKLDYLEGSAVLTNGSNPNGIKASDNLINGGTYIGDYKPGAAAYIRFNAMVPKDLSIGCYNFKNVANVDTDQTDWVNNQANVKVCYEAAPQPPVTPPVKPPVTPPTPPTEIPTSDVELISTAPTALPVSGPLEAAGVGFGSLAFSGSLLSYVRSKKKLLSAFKK